MLTSIVHDFRLTLAALAAALILQWLIVPAVAGEHDDFKAALRQATDQYRIAMNTLEARGREETSAEVARFRETLQAVIKRFDANHALLAGHENYPGLFMQVDTSLVGAMIVIDIGSREAARSALAPIADTLVKLNAAAAAAE
jgi:hypothetical protein